MNRYSVIEKKNKREIVLLKGFPCRWGRCSFCDYISDNSSDEILNNSVNVPILDQVKGTYGVLEVINSGNIFELPLDTLHKIKDVIDKKSIHTIFFESHWIYKNKIESMRDFFGVKCIVKTGVETFDTGFREKILQKGFGNASPEEIAEIFDSPCLLVGIQGQTREMIRNDIEIAQNLFDHFTVNVYINNSTPIKRDPSLVQWFEEEYAYLEGLEKCDILWNNTDFGVGD